MTNAVSGMSAALYQDEPEEYVVTAALGSNRDICFVSKNGTDASVEIIVSGSNTPLSIADSGTKVTVNSATNAGGVATSTAAAIVAAFNLDAEAAAVFTARLPPGSTGAGVTGALSETHATNGKAFTTIALVDSGDGLTWQAAEGSRYWDEDLTLTIYDDASEVTSGFTVNYLRGSVTFETAKSGDITATGTRRSELAFEKVMNLYDGKLNINGQDIDTSSLEDSGWGSSIIGTKKWSLTAGFFYYDGSMPITRIGTRLITKFYAIALTDSFVGIGALASTDYVIASATEAQKQNITINGQGEIYPE